MSPEAGDCPPLELKQVKLRVIHNLAVCGFLAVAMLATRQLNAQYLTLEGQTGGFLTPTAYVVYMEKGQAFSHPAVGFHFIDASKVIGNIETFSITEAFYGRAEAGLYAQRASVRQQRVGHHDRQACRITGPCGRDEPALELPTA